MQFKGDEFVRNIEIEKEKIELKEKMKKLEKQKAKTMEKEEKYFEDEPVIVDIQRGDTSNELNDIVLDDPKADAKKKYIILAISLTILFILTIVIIRLISDEKPTKELFEKQKVQTVEKEKALNALDSNEKYQELIDKKVQRTVKKKLNIDAMVKEETPIEEAKNANSEKNVVAQIEESDVFGMEAKYYIPKKKDIEVKQEPIRAKAPVVKPEPNPVVKKPKIKPEPKPIVKKPEIKQPKVAPKTTVNNKTGYYVQVGAFTQAPSQTLLTKVDKASYKYIIHKMTIKGTNYNKVLIGPYKDRKSVDAIIGKIKKDLNINGAYVLKIK